MKSLKGSILVSLEKYISVLFISLSFFVLAKYLPVDKLGEYSTIEAIVMICVIFSLLSLDTVFQDYYLKNSENIDVNEFYYNCFLIKLIGSAIGYVVSMSVIIGLKLDIYSSAVISTLIFFKSTTILTLYNITLRKEVRYFLIGVFSTLISFCIKMVIIYINKDNLFPLFYIIDFFSLFIFSGYYFLFDSKKLKTNYFWEILKIIKVRFYFILSSLSIVAFGKVDQILLAKYMTLGDVANYALSMKVIGIFVLVSSAFNLSLSRDLSITKNSGKDYYETVRKLMSLTIILGVAFCLFNYLSSPYAIKYIYGEKFNSSMHIVRYLSPLILLIFISSSVGRLLVVEELGKLAFARNILGLLVSVILNITLIPVYGLNGVIFSALCAWFISSIVVVLFSPRMRDIFFRSMYVK